MLGYFISGVFVTDSAFQFLDKYNAPDTVSLSGNTDLSASSGRTTYTRHITCALLNAVFCPQCSDVGYCGLFCGCCMLSWEPYNWSQNNIYFAMRYAVI